jgi:quercetin dioxygenase-like cupin family protein
MNPESDTGPAVPEDENELNRMLLDALAPRPPAEPAREALRHRLLARVGESLARHAGLCVVRRQDGSWQEVKAGIRSKLLWRGAAGASVLLEFAPGAMLPVHRHSHLEEGMVIEGRLQLGELDLGPGDYHASPQGSRHGRIGSREGALAFLRGSSLGHAGELIGELLGGLLPHRGSPAITLAREAGEWRRLQSGVEEKLLHREGGWQSRLLRLAPGAGLPWAPPATQEECMVIEGEAFLGDTLLQASEYQLATASTRYGEIASDRGALVFLRGDAARAPR